MIPVMDGQLSLHLHEKIPSMHHVEILLSLCDLKSLNSRKRIQPRIMCATFNDNPYTAVISCYSPTNAGDETDITNF